MYYLKYFPCSSCFIYFPDVHLQRREPSPNESFTNNKEEKAMEENFIEREVNRKENTSVHKAPVTGTSEKALKRLVGFIG